MAFPKTLLYRYAFRLILSRGLNKTYVFALTLSFPRRPFLRKHCVLRENQVFHTSHVLAGLMQGLFAACRVALSMVAGGTRRRRLNSSYPVAMDYGSDGSICLLRAANKQFLEIDSGVFGGLVVPLLV